MSQLVLIRHGESEWNALGKWTGKTDVGLTQKGIDQARAMGALLKDVEPHLCFLSTLSRSHHTWEAIIETRSWEHVPQVKHQALDERDYGELTGLNKWDVQTKVGVEAFHGIRRGWDHAVPGGETLKDVHARVVPYFESAIRPEISAGKRVLVCAHGNSIRALVKHLEQIADEDIPHLEIDFGSVRIYRFTDAGLIRDWEVRSV